ncbi:MAG TPA: hypothetical protein VFA40_11360 [Terriglobales bacterium]|nr:hypothetical protein [Terriglobales bacterium]
MLRRIRTTKKLAKRIDLQYFKRPHPLRRWRFWLSLSVPIVALGWLVAQRTQGGQKAYSSGPLSASHAVFTQQCSLCHVTRAGAFFRDVSDDACLACHDAPVHHAKQAFTPTCSSCHLEHKGSIHLASTSTASCTQCHENLRARDGKPHFAESIASFDRAHPDFSPAAKKLTDPGQLRLNHYLHMQPNLMGPNSKRVQMTCEDCHHLSGEHGPVAYAEELVTTGSLDQANILHTRSRPSPMLPVKFATECAGCHTLQFDTRFGPEQVPHDKPEAVHAFLVKRFQEYIGRNPASVHLPEPPTRQFPGRIRPVRIAGDASEWVQFRVDDAEWLLWSKTCKQCHALKKNAGTLPEIIPSAIRTRWLDHATFDHKAHRMMNCTACHTKALDSHDTADVLLPGIQTCRECHRDEARSKEVAEGRCFECHQYHDWSKAGLPKHRFTIPELRGTAELHVPQP